MRYTVQHLTVMLAATALTIGAAEPFDPSWNSIDGGGVMWSSGGSFVLSGTIGQPDAGVMTGGDFKLTCGFWFETPPGDCNENGAVGLMDHAAFVICLTGPDGDIVEGCACFDLNGDGGIDLADFAANQTGFFGE